ncbi:MAG: hypothetical protein LBU65_00810 [Planctomycetaceae bacterium]|jgi:hypothetical protein|nr:hypothetical protein [Planctomycetaceae bacterium]
MKPIILFTVVGSILGVILPIFNLTSLSNYNLVREEFKELEPAEVLVLAGMQEAVDFVIKWKPETENEIADKKHLHDACVHVAQELATPEGYYRIVAPYFGLGAIIGMVIGIIINHVLKLKKANKIVNSTEPHYGQDVSTDSISHQ